MNTGKQAMKVREYLEKHGARVGEAAVAELRFDASFRALCEQNSCGYYGACWTCPPDAGPIGPLMEKARSYERALVFQTVFPIEDPFDIEGMHEAGRRHNRLVRKVRRKAETKKLECLALGAGACGGCKTCAKKKGEPCRHPGRALLSLEACGIDAYQMGRLAGLPLSNGANTVSFLGVLLYHHKD